MVLKQILKTISFKTEDSHYLLFLSFGSAHLVWITVKSIRHQGDDTYLCLARA